jgi:hypothetical protein
LCGKYDIQTPVKASIELNQVIPDSVLKIFIRSGHSPFIEEPEEFVKVLKEWLLKLVHNKKAGICFPLSLSWFLVYGNMAFILQHDHHLTTFTIK